MNKNGKIAVVVALVAVVGAVLASKQRKQQADQAETQETPLQGVPQAAEPAPAPASASDANAKTKLPRLVDLGAGKCIPCKMMAPILAELKKTYAGRLEVEFIDVWEDPNAGREYKINMIPTQIFYDASGKELFRHEGFYSREGILGKWKELGVDLDRKQASN